MRNYILFILFIQVFLISSCKQQTDILGLKAEIQKMFKSEIGSFAVAFKDLIDGEQIFINESEEFHAASTMKTPVMIELYKQAEAGLFSLDDSILVKNEFYSIVDSSLYAMQIDDDSESVLYSKIGIRIPIRELNYEMITKSSNLATNILIDLVDAKKVTQTMREIGAKDIEVLRGVEDIKAFEKGLSNSTTAKDLLIIYEALAQGNLVSNTANEEMIEVLADQYWNDVIPKYLPKDLKIAHKTGTITGVHHDSGLVYLPDGRFYALILLSKEMEDFDKGTDMLARVSEKIYKYMNSKE